MRGARSRRATLHVRNAFPACNLAPRERAKTEQTLNVWLVIYRIPVSTLWRGDLFIVPEGTPVLEALPWREQHHLGEGNTISTVNEPCRVRPGNDRRMALPSSTRQGYVGIVPCTNTAFAEVREAGNRRPGERHLRPHCFEGGEGVRDPGTEGNNFFSDGWVRARGKLAVSGIPAETTASSPRQGA